MPEQKTLPTDMSVAEFLDAVEPEARRAEGRALDALFRHVTGFQPRMWGASLIGYGRYSYRYDSGHSGQSLATGFSPRKAELVLYVIPGYSDLGPELARLGPHRLGKSCLYVRRLDRVDMPVLEDIIRKGLAALATRWTVEPT
jgi:hypothetical protein